MPCNTIQTASIELGKVNADLLKLAMADLGVESYTITKSGQLTMQKSRGSLPDLAQVKVAYSRQVVLSQAKKFGWQMKETAPNQWQVVRQ